jgi:DNA polymerase-3 subunit beta
MPEQDVSEQGSPVVGLPYPVAVAAVAAVGAAVNGDLGRRGVLVTGGPDECVLLAGNGTSTVEVRIAGKTGLTQEASLLLDHPRLTAALGAPVKGATVTERKPLTATIAALPDGPSLALNGWTVPLVPCGEGGRPAAEERLSPVAEVPTEVFTAAVKRAAAATTTKSEQMPFLCGVLVELTNGWLTLVGSDRFRLAAERVGAPVVGDEERLPVALLVDGATLAAVAKHFVADRVTIGWRQEPMGVVMSFTCGGVTLWTRGLVGAFAAYGPLVTAPAGAARVRADRAALARAAVRATAIADLEGSTDVLVTFDRTSVTVRPALRDRPEAVSGPVLPAATAGLAGQLVVRFNGARLTAALEAVGTKRVVIYPAPAPARTIVVADAGGGAVRGALVPSKGESGTARETAQEGAGAIASAA